MWPLVLRIRNPMKLPLPIRHSKTGKMDTIAIRIVKIPGHRVVSSAGFRDAGPGMG